MYLAFATGNGGQMIEVLIIKNFKTSQKNWVKESTCDQNRMIKVIFIQVYMYVQYVLLFVNLCTK